MHRRSSTESYSPDLACVLCGNRIFFYQRLCFAQYRRCAKGLGVVKDLVDFTPTAWIQVLRG